MAPRAATSDIATQNRPPDTISLPPSSASMVQAERSLLSSAFAHVEPTWRDYIRYVDAEARTGNLDARRYLDCWLRIGEKGRKAHYPEQLCDLAKVQPADLVSWVSRQAYLEGAAQAAMVITFRCGPVLAKVAEFAMESAENGRQQEMFMKAAGLLPTGGRGGGPLPTLFSPAGTSSSGSVAGVKSDSAPVDRSGLRDMDAEIVELSRVMQTGGTGCAAEDEPDEEDEESEDDDDNEDRD